TSKERLENEINSSVKCHRTVTYPKLNLALKKFMLIYQHKTILSDVLLIEKAKTLANGLGIPQGALSFSPGESASADEIAINNILLVLKNMCANYPVERIYNMNET
ncbi:13940_t:CDS:2, partial [Dentiscutata erythropus]